MTVLHAFIFKIDFVSSAAGTSEGPLNTDGGRRTGGPQSPAHHGLKPILRQSLNGLGENGAG